MRSADDPAVKRFEIDWSQPGLWPVANWTTGWFWWRGYGTPATATVTVGVAGEITFPIRCRWGDGRFYEMFLLRYDTVRQSVDLINKDPDSHEFNLDRASVEATDIYVESGDFSPDALFSQLASILDVALLTDEQAAEFSDGLVDSAWVPVDVDQGPVEFASTEELDA